MLIWKNTDGQHSLDCGAVCWKYCYFTSTSYSNSNENITSCVR